MNQTVSFQQLFKNKLKAKSFFSSRDKILVACSGGPDSTALFYLLRESFPELKIVLLHFNHKLRPNAAGDVKFVQNLAKQFKVPFYSGAAKKPASKKLSVEEAAREQRYDFFIRTARKLKISKIVLAHTLDDQAETVLMRLIQGTGPRGLLGIREILERNGVTFIRPLLDCSKKKILDYLKKRKISFRQDESNRSPRFLRNRIRLKLLPLLRKEFNPGVAEALSRFPAILKEEQALLAELEEKEWRNCLKKDGRNKVVLKRKAFEKMHPALQFRLLDKALKRIHASSGMSFESWNLFSPHLKKKKSRFSFPKDIDLALKPGKILLFLK